MSIQLPAHLGRYRLTRVRGQGAMGIVYEAEDTRLGRVVAVKTVQRNILFDESTASDFAERFEREARAAASLSHPNIVTVYDFGEHEGSSFIVMELVRGSELAQTFDAGNRPSLDESLQIMVQLLDALDYAHRQGIVHRDIKPANVMIDETGRVKLTDFGVARVATSAQDRTMPGTQVGTPSYMAPEQVLGAAVGSRADIFAAGVVLYQCLTGRRPFRGNGAFQIQRQIVQDDPPPPSTLVPGLPSGIDGIVARALAKRPEDRYATARLFADDLRDCLGPASEGDAAPAVQAADPDATVILKAGDWMATAMALRSGSPAPTGTGGTSGRAARTGGTGSGVHATGDAGSPAASRPATDTAPDRFPATDRGVAATDASPPRSQAGSTPAWTDVDRSRPPSGPPAPRPSPSGLEATQVVPRPRPPEPTAASPSGVVAGRERTRFDEPAAPTTGGTRAPATWWAIGAALAAAALAATAWWWRSPVSAPPAAPPGAATAPTSSRPSPGQDHPTGAPVGTPAEAAGDGPTEASAPSSLPNVPPTSAAGGTTPGAAPGRAGRAPTPSRPAPTETAAPRPAVPERTATTPPPRPPAAAPAPAPAAATDARTAPPPARDGGRCASLLQRMQLGEQLLPADDEYFQTRCTR